MSMSFYVCEFEFEGPGLTPNELQAECGVFLLLHHVDDDAYELLDFGQFENLKGSWNSIDFDFFKTSYPGDVSLAVHYCPGANRRDRREIVKAIRKEYEHLVEMGATTKASVEEEQVRPSLSLAR